jgi:hypothetical protein
MLGDNQKGVNLKTTTPSTWWTQKVYPAIRRRKVKSELWATQSQTQIKSKLWATQSQTQIKSKLWATQSLTQDSEEAKTRLYRGWLEVWGGGWW